MTAERRSEAPDHQAMVEAAEWFALLESEECTGVDRERWHQWLSRDSAHEKAWSLVEQINADFTQATSGPAREALDAAGRSRRAALKTLLGIGVTVPAAWFMSHSDLMKTWDSDLHTSTGDIRAVTLSDGSQLWLDTASAVRLDFDASSRTIELLAGAIHIHTAADPRPLQVVTGQTRIRPLGTSFSVSRHEDPVTVAVEEGEVEVTSQIGRQIRIKAGKKALIEDSDVQVSSTDPEDFGWKDGRLVVDNMALGQLTRQLNRYHTGMIVTTPEAARIRVVGAFSLDNIDQTLNALSDSLPLTVSRITPWFVLIST